MRFFTTLFVAGALAVVSAQTTTVTPAQSTTVSIDSSQTSAQSEILKCLNACNPGDVACTSKCIAVPNPDASQVNATNECIAACPAGNGTETDILNYKNCRDGCIGKYYYTTGGTPQATGGSGGSAGTSGGSTGTITSGANSAPTGSTSGSASGAAASSTSKAAADVVRVAGPAAGLLGFIAAILAL
ncbi:hypothetical protein GQ53DRAFT_752082 [Thozetella sp. PMI_491]|nr:hypothetical protein GQ53DRAFT_752082 [Thozetella sp. PMI_491]